MHSHLTQLGKTLGILALVSSLAPVSSADPAPAPASPRSPAATPVIRARIEPAAGDEEATEPEGRTDPVRYQLQVGSELSQGPAHIQELGLRMGVVSRVSDMWEVEVGGSYHRAHRLLDERDFSALGIGTAISVGSRQGNRLSAYLRPELRFLLGSDVPASWLLSAQLGLDYRAELHRANYEGLNLGVRLFTELYAPTAAAPTQLSLGLGVYLAYGLGKYRLNTSTTSSADPRSYLAVLVQRELSDVSLGDPTGLRDGKEPTLCEIQIPAKGGRVSSSDGCDKKLEAGVEPGTCAVVVLVNNRRDEGLSLTAYEEHHIDRVISKDDYGDDWPVAMVCNLEGSEARNFELSADPHDKNKGPITGLATRYDAAAPGVGGAPVKRCAEALQAGHCCLVELPSAGFSAQVPVDDNVKHVLVSAPWYMQARTTPAPVAANGKAEPDLSWSRPRRVFVPPTHRISVTGRSTGGPVAICADAT